MHACESSVANNDQISDGLAAPWTSVQQEFGDVCRLLRVTIHARLDRAPSGVLFGVGVEKRWLPFWDPLFGESNAERRAPIGFDELVFELSKCEFERINRT